MSPCVRLDPEAKRWSCSRRHELEGPELGMGALTASPRRQMGTPEGTLGRGLGIGGGGIA